VSSRVSGRRVDAQVFQPPEDLRHVVESCWVGRWNLVGQAPHVTELLGDPCVHLCVERGASRVVGVWSKRWVRTLQGEGLVRAVKLRAGAVRAFLDVSASELTDRILPLSVFVDDAAWLERDVLDPVDDATAAARWMARLRAMLRPVDVAMPVAACAAIAGDRELTGVHALSARFGVSVRALQRLFRDHVGITPKRAIMRARLQEAALQIETGAAPNLARLAADLGYTDEAHFNRDFKSAVGRTPREFESALDAEPE
jgi:AraC-like DNA-binding protein